jgi:peptide deformylase
MTLPDSVLTLGHPILRLRSQPVHCVRNPQLQQLIDHMLTLTRSANGVGIAAPQLGYSYRVIVVASRPNLRYPNAPLMDPVVLVNPRIVAHSDERVKGWEGCLSVPGVRGYVPRYRQVDVEYIDRHGQEKRCVWEDFVARILQHEHDHLEGKVFLDSVEHPEDMLSEEAYQAQVINALG